MNVSKTNDICRAVRLGLTRPFEPSGPRRAWVLVLGLMAILAWQRGFAREDATIDTTYKNAAASGMHEERQFVYFYW